MDIPSGLAQTASSCLYSESDVSKTHVRTGIESRGCVRWKCELRDFFQDSICYRTRFSRFDTRDSRRDDRSSKMRPRVTLPRARHADKYQRNHNKFVHSHGHITRATLRSGRYPPGLCCLLICESGSQGLKSATRVWSMNGSQYRLHGPE